MSKQIRFIIVLFLLLAVTAAAASAKSAPDKVKFSAQPVFSEAVAFDEIPALSEFARTAPLRLERPTVQDLLEIRPDRGPVAVDKGYSADGALQAGGARLERQATAQSTTAAPPTLANFEGISNNDNFNIFGFRVNPPDTVGDVGRDHYVEMVNLAYAVYDKQGNLLLGPVDTGELWRDFAVEDCTDPSGDPIVLYDQLVNRWILTQFTTRGFDDPELPFYDCVAVSKTPDPTGPYYRYAFITQPDTVDGGYFFPDYPKYGVWTDSYLMTTRDFGLINEYGISVYALEKAKMISGNPKARAVQFFLDSNVVPLELIGDGLLPADIDGSRRPQAHVPAPIMGTMDDDWPFYGATI